MLLDALSRLIIGGIQVLYIRLTYINLCKHFDFRYQVGILLFNTCVNFYIKRFLSVMSHPLYG